MIEIRPIRKEEISDAKLLVPPSCCEPDWPSIWVVKDGAELKGIFGLENRLVVEPCYIARSNTHALMTMTWIDGFLRATAMQLGKGGYEFFVGDDAEGFQGLLNRHFPVNGREKAGKFYFRKFEV